MNINNLISEELSVKPWQTENVLKLRADGGTIPFIARYRKEKTGNLDENVIRDIFDRQDYLTELEERRQTILESIDKQGKLTDELREKIRNCHKKTELEDIYLPYKPKRRTRAVIARENGLEPLAETIKEHNSPKAVPIDIELEAGNYLSEKVESIAGALKGASDIIAEEIAENADLRAWIRRFFATEGVFVSKIKEDFPEGTTKFETYRDFSIAVKSVSPHVMLALRRGESEGVLTLDLEFDEEKALDYIYSKNVFSSQENVASFIQKAAKDAFNRLMKHSIIGEVRLEKKVFADEASIRVFESNLRQMLLSSPAGMKPALGIDPGFRTGCKVAVINSTGKFIKHSVIFPDKSDAERIAAEEKILDMIDRHDIDLIAIGNGTAGRETDEFIGRILEKHGKELIKVMVSEAGASVYSASKTAGEEFPDLDLTVRGAISIGRRLQDPLAELVKIDPKSIGVGQYQHDVDQKLLKKKLAETVESCVNYVGIDLNTASKELLTYVSGLSSSVAANIINWRDENGAFLRRDQLLKVPKFGEKTFELAAGFLRIRDGESVLDNTGVHPESYHIVEKIASDIDMSLASIPKAPEKLKSIDIKRYITENVGEPTLRDIISELEKPGRDPREEFRYAKFKEGVNSISDLREGMKLEGVVTNITNFGAFVDIGVHQDGLVHISEMANHFVKDPTKIVKVGQVVDVLVLDINEKLGRIQLSIKRLQKPQKKSVRPKYDVNDLKNKFGAK